MLQNGETVLHRAAVMGRVEEVKMLVKHGAAVDIRDKVYLCIYGYRAKIMANLARYICHIYYWALFPR